MSSEATAKKREHVLVRGDLHDRAKKWADLNGGITLQRITDWAYELWLSKNENKPIRKAGRK